MLQLTRPRYFVPIHGEYRHLVRHQKLAQDVGDYRRIIVSFWKTVTFWR